MSEQKYIRVEDAILAAQEGADVWDGGCNPERDKHIRLAISAKPTYTPAEILAGIWVPVTELNKLPEVEEVVQITDGEYVSHGYITERRKDGTAVWYSDFFDLDKVTHWAPQLEPPKEGVK